MIADSKTSHSEEHGTDSDRKMLTSCPAVASICSWHFFQRLCCYSFFSEVPVNTSTCFPHLLISLRAFRYLLCTEDTLSLNFGSRLRNCQWRPRSSGTRIAEQSCHYVPASSLMHLGSQVFTVSSQVSAGKSQHAVCASGGTGETGVAVTPTLEQPCCWSEDKSRWGSYSSLSAFEIDSSGL